MRRSTASSRRSARSVQRRGDLFGTPSRDSKFQNSKFQMMMGSESESWNWEFLFGCGASRVRNSTLSAVKRFAEIVRQTRETDIRLTLDLDGAGRAEVVTGIGFLDHMLEL